MGLWYKQIVDIYSNILLYLIKNNYLNLYQKCLYYKIMAMRELYIHIIMMVLAIIGEDQCRKYRNVYSKLSAKLWHKQLSMSLPMLLPTVSNKLYISFTRYIHGMVSLYKMYSCQMLCIFCYMYFICLAMLIERYIKSLQTKDNKNIHDSLSFLLYLFDLISISITLL